MTPFLDGSSLLSSRITRQYATPLSGGTDKQSSAELNRHRYRAVSAPVHPGFHGRMLVESGLCNFGVRVSVKPCLDVSRWIGIIPPVQCLCLLQSSIHHGGRPLCQSSVEVLLVDSGYDPIKRVGTPSHTHVTTRGCGYAL
jgi:hypothetical protein